MKTKKLLMALSVAVLTGTVTLSKVFTANEQTILNAKENEIYELADTLYDFNFADSKMFTNEWGVQDATVNFIDGKMVAKSAQEIDGTMQMGSYHTKFKVSFDANNSGNFWSMMLRQNSDASVSSNRKDVNGTTIDIGANYGYEIFIQNGMMQLFESNGDTRTNMYEGNGYRFEMNDDKLWDATKVFESEYEMEIYVLNLKDGSVQFIINVDGNNVINTNTSAWDLKFEKPLLNGAFRYGIRNSSNVNSTFTSECLNIVEHSNDEIPETEYKINDTLTEWNFTDSSAFLSKWGNQDNVLTFDEKNHSMTAYAGQQIDGTIDMGSYHTKFDLTFDNKSAWWDMMLRQNSGTKTAANNDGRMIDTGTACGYEIFIQNGHLELFEKVGDSRVAMYAAPNQFGYSFTEDEWNFPAAGSTYTFDVWVLNLSDGSVQFVIDVDGNNVINTNTSAWNLSLESPITTGAFRINDAAASGVQTTFKGYSEMGANTLVKGSPILEYDVDSEIDVNDLEFTTIYDSFIVTFAADKSQVSGLNFRQTGQQKMIIKAVEKELEYIVNVSPLAGATYEIKQGHKKEYLVGEEYANDIVVVRKYNDSVKEYTLRSDEITLLDTTTSGNKELTITLEGQELKVTLEVADYSLKDNLKNEFLKDEEYNNQFVVIKTVGEETKDIIINANEIEGFDTTTTGKKTVTFKCGKEFIYQFDVADYEIRSFYQDSYKVNEEYANDIFVVRTCGNEVSETSIELSMLNGFDTTTSGVKDVTIDVAGKRLTLSIEVYEYIIKQGYKNVYKVGEEYAGDIIVLRKVGNIETEVIKISGFDSSTAGEKTLTITVNGQNLEAKINVEENKEEKPNTNKGCKGEATSTLFALLATLGTFIFGKKRK